MPSSVSVDITVGLHKRNGRQSLESWIFFITDRYRSYCYDSSVCMDVLTEPYTVREARIHVRHVRDLLKSVDSADAYGGVDCSSLSFLNHITAGDILGKSFCSVSLLSVLSWLHDMGDMLGKFLFLCFVLSFNLFLGKKKKKCSFSVNFNRISKWLQNLLLCWNCQPGDSYHTDTRTPFISLSKFAFLTSYVWDDFCGFM